ncbi:MAG: hemerythrin family protein [Candidatus Omnitrophica bacterium]|nr:hemerythrin family protein [Candidatus Omnitrophota bacterium]
MKKIDWDEKMSMGINAIDVHHQKLIGYINALQEAVDKGQTDKAFLEDLVDRLIDYTDYHFSAEEKYMKLYEYPELKSHCEEHTAFIAEVKRFKDFLQAKPTEKLEAQMLSYLQTWLIHHILIIDKEYAIYFSEKGIKIDR